MQHVEVTISTEVLVRMIDEALRIGRAGTDGDFTNLGILYEFVLRGKTFDDVEPVKPFHHFDLDVISEDDENEYHSLAKTIVEDTSSRINAVKRFRDECRDANGNAWNLRDTLYTFIDPAAERMGKVWGL